MQQNVYAIPPDFEEGRHLAEGIGCSLFEPLQVMVLIVWLVIP